MIILNKKNSQGCRLPLTFGLAILTCVALPLPAVWGQSSIHPSAHVQDLPSYRMAKEVEEVEAVDERQALPIPFSPEKQPSSISLSPKDTAQIKVDAVNIPPRQLTDHPEPIQYSEQEAIQPRIAEQDNQPDERGIETSTIPSTFADIDSENLLGLPQPTFKQWSFPARWNSLVPDAPQGFDHDLANPLQRYEPLFHPDWTYAPNAVTHPYGTVPLVLNRHVERNLNYFRVGIFERFQGYLNRFEKYKQMVNQIFSEFGLPPELAYLSLVESGFNPRAYSRARASGPWQFMKATGRMYGLKVTWYVDERRDPVKSTIAAAHHLRDLYDQFGSWPLALGAYNAGGGKIGRAIRRTGSRDFWKIRRTWYIRRETKEYVPRFIAATLIASHPSDYGFSITPVEPYAYDEVLIHKRVHLKAVAKTAGVSFEELRELNPELRRSIVPALRKGYALKVPVGVGAIVKQQHDLIQPWTQPPPPATTWYRVRYGDSLSVVAKRFGMKVRSLKRLNRLSGNMIRVGDRLRVRGGDRPIDLKSRWYTVRRGDHLSGIASKFGTTAQALKNLNNLSGHLIHVGDKLQVRGTTQPSRPKGETKWYRVRQGDSLWTIARRFSVSVTDLKILNNLTTSAIRAGHLLLVSQ